MSIARCLLPARRSLRGNVDRNINQAKVNAYVASVVPYVGTWIEIYDLFYNKWIGNRRSLRGNVDRNVAVMVTSYIVIVVPYVGTWIEMPCTARSAQVSGVVPYVGTWIEIRMILYGR